MARSKKRNRDPLPERFSSLEEAGEFWDTHSSTDYEEHMKDVSFDVELQRSVHEVRITDEVLREIRKIARKKGVTTETLVNLWLREKVVTASPPR